MLWKWKLQSMARRAAFANRVLEIRDRRTAFDNRVLESRAPITAYANRVMESRTRRAAFANDVHGRGLLIDESFPPQPLHAVNHADHYMLFGLKLK